MKMFIMKESCIGGTEVTLVPETGVRYSASVTYHGVRNFHDD